MRHKFILRDVFLIHLYLSVAQTSVDCRNYLRFRKEIYVRVHSKNGVDFENRYYAEMSKVDTEQ